MIGRCRMVMSLLFLVCVSSGCVVEPDGYERDEQGAGGAGNEVVAIKFDVRKTRSSIEPEESEISDVNLYAFCDGELAAEGYFEYGDPLVLKLLYGHRYSLYALANVGKVDACSDEERFLKECVCEISGIKDLEKCLPMAWNDDGFVVDSWADRVSIDFSRLVSKVFFSVDKDALEGLEIKAVRVRQNPTSVWPFRYPEGSRVVAESDVSDGDYATAIDLSSLNSGEKICFYVPENCQGRILDGNTDPWAKVPENISGKEGLCTYIELECSFDEGGFYSGNVIYRLFLGADSVADFNIRRNSVLDVSLFLTGSGLGEVSWRVDADVFINDGHARGWLSRGLHSITDLYMGEKFIYTLELTPQMMDHLGGLYENVRLCSCDDGGSGESPIEFGIPRFTKMSGDLYQFETEGLCRTQGAGSLCLTDKKGNRLVSLGEFQVQKPILYVSDEGRVSSGSRVPGIGGPLLLDVNGSERYAFMYLVDRERCNLNSSYGVGLDFSLFDFSRRYEDINDSVAGSMRLRVIDGDELDDGPFLTCALSSKNDGRSDELSRSLLEFWSAGSIGGVVFDDEEADVTQRLEFGLQYLPITLTLVDNGWAGYSDCQISMVVDNPSNFPIKGQCWQLNMLKDSYNAVYRNEIVDLYGKEFTRQAYEYVCGDFPAGLMPFYCSGAAFSAKNSCVCHFQEISTQIINNAALYDYMSQDVLYHHIDAVFENGDTIYGLKAVDNLSDGTMQYDIIYGNDPDMDGWDDRGVWLYSGGVLISRPGADFDSLSGLKPINLSELEAGKICKLLIAYDADKGTFTACVDSSQGIGLQLNAEVTVNASGYVSTTPKGTMFGSVDNHCSSKVSQKLSDVVLGLTPVEIDGGAVKSAMNAIYAQTFFDSYNLIGSTNNYDHHAHPTSLEVSLRFSLSGAWGDRMVPIKVTAPSVVSYYHGQERITYSVSVKTDLRLNRVAFVKNLGE